MIRVMTILILLLFSTTAEASVTVYTDRSAWESALVSFSEESFEDSALSPEISVSSTLPGYVDDVKGVWWDSLYGVRGTGGPTTTTWQFSKPIYAYGGNWNCAGIGGTGTGIAVSCGNTGTAVGEISRTYAGDFWGFICTDQFSQVRLESGSGSGWAESYELDNMVYGSVPEPSSFMALMAGFVTIIKPLMWTRKRRE
ncbi:MAG TPA: hypothetical protein VHV83_10195 [Armatimonadota bacterium]|nr:hypothetical protein [Armatimonadota bacterium]